MNKMSYLITVCIGLLMAGALFMHFGCSGNNSQNTITPPMGQLHGDWGGVQAAGDNTPNPKVSGSIIHQIDADTISGVMSVNGEQFTITGTVNKKSVKMILTNTTSTITWTGTYAGGRLNGAYSSTPTTAAKALAKIVGSTVTPSSGSISMIKYVNIQGVIEMGPWLLYTQNNADKSSNMTIRLGMTQVDTNGKKYKPSAVVTVKDADTDVSYGTFAMTPTYIHEYATGSGNDTVGVFQYTFSGLPANRLYDYTITITDAVNGTYPVSASFVTPPSQDDITSKKATSQVFYSYGDNRRLYYDPLKFNDTESKKDELPVVEEDLIINSGIQADYRAQSCILNNGDATTLGRHVEYNGLTTLGFTYGWKYEWLKSSSSASDSRGHDLRYHTWLRASMPTYLGAGNHEAKTNIGDNSYDDPQVFNVYGSLMAGVYASKDDNVVTTTNPKYGAYDTYTYMADYGGMRVIVWNTYLVKPDPNIILNKIVSWMENAYADGPIILLMHPSPYGNENTKKDVSDYWSTSSDLRAALEGKINAIAASKNIKNRLIVISGHTHVTTRTFQDGINYYILGTGGAPDMGGPASDNALFANFSTRAGKTGKQFLHEYAYGKFTIDYSARTITAAVLGMNKKVVDEHSWSY